MLVNEKASSTLPLSIGFENTIIISPLTGRLFELSDGLIEIIVGGVVSGADEVINSDENSAVNLFSFKSFALVEIVKIC